MSGRSQSGRKALPLIMLVVVSAAAGSYGYLSRDEQPQIDRRYWNNPGGPVMFEHRAHIDMTEACADCHHDVLLAEPEQLCRDCHGDDLDADDFDHADLVAVEAHACRQCHRIDESKPIKSCRDCHPSTQESEPTLVTCVECHDDDYSADLMSHDDMLAIDSHTCDGCHVIRSVSDVYHEQCYRCHERENPDLFTDAEDNMQCNVCHLK